MAAKGTPGIPYFDEGLAAAGLIGGLVSGSSAAKAQKEALRRQAQLINKQSNIYGQTSPYYLQLLQAAANQLHLNQANPGGEAPQGVGTVTTPTGTFGAYGSRRTLSGATYNAPAAPPDYGGLTPEDNLRLHAAEDDINHYAKLGADRLRFNANLSGLNTGAVGAGLARNENEALRNYAQFRRNLAIQAPEMQQQRLANFANLLSPGFGQGAAASAGYGQQGLVYGNQANQGFGMAGNALQNYQYQKNLKRYGQNPLGVPNGG